MSIELEHDWRDIITAPKPKLGERTKMRLLLLLCLLWVGFGLVGHEPWKPNELKTVSIIKYFHEGGNWATPSIAGDHFVGEFPLYYLVAAASAKIFSPWLSLHDAARLTTGLWMALTLLLVGMTGRELWGRGCGRQATLIFLGSIGLVFSAHMLNPEVSGLTGYAMIFYAFSLAPRQPLFAGFLLGTGAGIGFLSKGLLPAEFALAMSCLLPILFSHWRRTSYLLVLIFALIAFLPWIVPWLLVLKKSPELLQIWLNTTNLPDTHFLYFAETLTWYAWPALPLAVWTLLKVRTNPASIQITVLFFLLLMLLFGIGAEDNDIQALPLLLPLVLLGTPAVDRLTRSVASILDWFGIMLFGTLGILIWLGWLAMMTGIPEKLAQRMHVLSPVYVPEFTWLAFIPALALTLIWVSLVLKTNKRTNRAAVTDWAVGMTLVWGLVMTLWLPWLDASKNYAITFKSLAKALPSSYACITSRNIGNTQRAALDYYANIRVQRFELVQSLGCDLYLIQNERRKEKIDPGPDWTLIWKGNRPNDKREKYELFQRAS